MKPSPSRRLRLAGLLFILVLLIVAACWIYLLKPRSAPPRDWLIVTSEPTCGWQTNAAGALAPAVLMEASNCGPREIVVSSRGYCSWAVPTGVSSGETNYSWQNAFLASVLLPNLVPGQTTNLVVDLSAFLPATNRNAVFHNVSLYLSWREPPKPFQIVRGLVSIAEDKLLREGLIDHSWSRTYSGGTNISLRNEADLRKLLPREQP